MWNISDQWLWKFIIFSHFLHLTFSPVLTFNDFRLAFLLVLISLLEDDEFFLLIESDKYEKLFPSACNTC